MTVRVTPDGKICLDGACPVGDAEPLLRLVANNRDAIVDWRGCEQAHAAVIQVLLAAQPTLLGPPANAFLHSRIAPLISGRHASPAQASMRE
jgi:hypothetical protein